MVNIGDVLGTASKSVTGAANASGVRLHYSSVPFGSLPVADRAAPMADCPDAIFGFAIALSL